MKIKELKENVGINGINVEGDITKIYPQKSGEGKYGRWTMQTITIGDETGSIPVVIWNHPEIKGQGIFKAISVPGKNGEPEGIEVIGSRYTDKKGEEQEIIKVKVDRRARILSPAFVVEGKPMEENIPTEKGDEISDDTKMEILEAVCYMFRINEFPVPKVLKEDIVEIARYIEREYFTKKQAVVQEVKPTIIQKIKAREQENIDDEEIPF